MRVARNREPGVTIEKIAKEFGVHPMTLQEWFSRAAVENGSKPGQTRIEPAELREVRKRVWLLVPGERGAAAGGVLVAGEPAEKRSVRS